MQQQNSSTALPSNRSMLSVRKLANIVTSLVSSDTGVHRRSDPSRTSRSAGPGSECQSQLSEHSVFSSVQQQRCGHQALNLSEHYENTSVVALRLKSKLHNNVIAAQPIIRSFGILNRAAAKVCSSVVLTFMVLPWQCFCYGTASGQHIECTVVD